MLYEVDSPRTYVTEHNEIDHKAHRDMLIVDLYCTTEIHLYLLTALKHEYNRSGHERSSNLPRNFSVLRSCLAFLFDEKLQISQPHYFNLLKKNMKWRVNSYFDLITSLTPCSFLSTVIENDVKFILNTFITIKLEIRLEA